MLLDAPSNPKQTLARLGGALRRARKTLGKGNSDDFGKAVGVSGRTMRQLETSGKGSTESLVRLLMALCPEALDALLQQLEDVEPPYTSVDEAMAASHRTSSQKTRE